MNFETIWSQIKSHEGEVFHTKTGLPFKYQILNNAVIPDRTGFPLAKSNFEKAAKIDNLIAPGQINKLVMGPSYVYAILTDQRIQSAN